MISRFFHIVSVLIMMVHFRTVAQPDLEPPLSPVLSLVTVNQSTGFSELTWTLSPSTDVSGYVVYSYINNEGYAIDTIHSATASGYIHTSRISSELSRSYVVAAFDNAGNISPLSNALNTIFTTASLDSCNRKLQIRWNSYPSFPKQVSSYTILYSVDKGPYTEAGKVSKDMTSFTISDFTYDAQYCFLIRADLDGGFSSVSNGRCLSTRMQKPPEWINADYATVDPEDEILLSFRIDPQSEISSYILERKTDASGSFSEIYRFTYKSESFQYADALADVSKVNYYRLVAMNNCSIPVTVSNIASNIVVELIREEDNINLAWNPYRTWNGSVESYRLYINTGLEFEERFVILPPDTSITVKYSDLMYEVTGYNICFMIRAFEFANPYGVSGESRSSGICSEVTEIITVPNLFTPDNNLVNDWFIPVLSFTPVDYHLLITNISRNRIFESRDCTQKWDGTRSGEPVPEGVYLWFLEVITPSGKSISRTGTVTIIRPAR